MEIGCTVKLQPAEASVIRILLLRLMFGFFLFFIILTLDSDSYPPGNGSRG